MSKPKKKLKVNNFIQKIVQISKISAKKRCCIIIKKDLRDQILKKETKCDYYIKTLKINN